MLSDRCLSVGLSVCLSVMFVYSGQTVGWINMKLAMQVGLGPGHTVLDGDPLPSSPLSKKREQSPQFSTHVYCGLLWGMVEVGLVSPDGVASAGWSVRLPLLIFACTIKSRSSLLAPAHLGNPGKRP